MERQFFSKVAQSRITGGSAELVMFTSLVRNCHAFAPVPQPRSGGDNQSVVHFRHAARKQHHLQHIESQTILGHNAVRERGRAPGHLLLALAHDRVRHPSFLAPFIVTVLNFFGTGRSGSLGLPCLPATSS